MKNKNQTSPYLLRSAFPCILSYKDKYSCSSHNVIHKFRCSGTVHSCMETKILHSSKKQIKMLQFQFPLFLSSFNQGSVNQLQDTLSHANDIRNGSHYLLIVEQSRLFCLEGCLSESILYHTFEGMNLNFILYSYKK